VVALNNIRKAGQFIMGEGGVMSFSMIRVCKVCGSKNRVPARHLAHTGRCGSCKSPLPPLSESLDVDENAFADIVREADVPILVDFWAPWCGPCKVSAPEVQELARETSGKALVLKVNTEEHPGLAARFKVQSIPNFVVLRDGRVVSQRPGWPGRAEMRRWFEEAMRATPTEHRAAG
jgi:thioredoxin 2